MNLIQFEKLLSKIKSKRLKGEFIELVWEEIPFNQNRELVIIAQLHGLNKLALDMRIKNEGLFELNARTNEVLINHLESMPDQSKDKLKNIQSNLY